MAIKQTAGRDALGEFAPKFAQINDDVLFGEVWSREDMLNCGLGTFLTKEEFDNYYRDINTFRKAQQRHGKCVCPEKKRLDCDMDCATCPFRRAGDSVSLDYTVSDDDGEKIAWLDSLEAPSPLIDDIVADSERMAELFERLKQLMPQAIEIGKLRQKGIPDVQIAELIGVHRNTFGSRLNRVKEILKKEFPEFF